MHAMIAGRRIAYTDAGSGTPVVLLHAFPLSRAMWEPQIPALAQRVRVIAVDLRGHGESEFVEGAVTLMDYADDVIRLLDHLAIATAVFAGLSMGGYTLFALYRRYRDRIKGFVLADTRAQADTPEGRAGRFDMIRTAEGKGNDAIAEIMLPRLLAPESLSKNAPLVERVRSIITRNPVGTIIADLRAMADRPDSVALLPSISCPTLVIVGELDQGTPPPDARLMAERIPGARLVIIPKAGHLSNLEQPEIFNQALLSFLETMSR
jgi:pimeloyl-ACP methyl ester carboxylesterase